MIYYAKIDNPWDDRLKRLVEIHVPRDRLENYQTMSALLKRLQQPLPDSMIFVLLLSDQEEISTLLEYGEYFHHHRLLLVLVDDDPTTVAQGYAMRPRYLTFVDADLIDISAVLGKMIQAETAYESQVIGIAGKGGCHEES
ncbi:MAG: hypothetical protein N2Z74_09000 [Syntrophales bacterium]|nr:hypothetical protein [Syntrophales bacterium]